MRNIVKDLELEDEEYETFERFKPARPKWKGPKRRNVAKDKIRAERLRREQERQEMTEGIEDEEYES